MKLSKIFIIVLIAHVVAIGGILGYQYYNSHKMRAVAENKTETTVTESENPVIDIDNAVGTELTPSAPSGVVDPVTTMTPSENLNASAPRIAVPGQEPVEPTGITTVETVTPVVTPTTGATAIQAQPVSNVAATTTIQHTVVSGDSLYKIAKKHGTTVAELKTANSLTTDALKIGQKVNVPSRVASGTTVAAAPLVEAPVVQAPIATTGGRIYVVKKGDALVKIARSEKTTVEAIKAANNMQTDALKIGQKLVIPTNSTTIATPTQEPALEQANGVSIYTVVSGDSIAKISKRFNVSSDEIMKANGIKDPKKLQIGQKLNIPATDQKQVVTPPTPATPTGGAGPTTLVKFNTIVSSSQTPVTVANQNQ